MGTNIEWLVGILRAGPDFKKYGDPYTFSGTIFVNGDNAEIRGASSDITILLSERESIAKDLKKVGVKSVSWKRVKDSKTKIITKYIGDKNEF